MCHLLFQVLIHLLSHLNLNITVRVLLLSSPHSLEGKLMQREVKQTAQEHTASKRQRRMQI